MKYTEFDNISYAEVSKRNGSVEKEYEDMKLGMVDKMREFMEPYVYTYTNLAYSELTEPLKIEWQPEEDKTVLKIHIPEHIDTRIEDKKPAYTYKYDIKDNSRGIELYAYEHNPKKLDVGTIRRCLNEVVQENKNELSADDIKDFSSALEGLEVSTPEQTT